MRITGEQSQIAGQVGAVAGASAPAATTNETVAVTGAVSPAATVSLSDQAQQISRAKQAVAAAPDVREDLVSSIKARVDAGTYNVSGNDIADMMLRRHSADTSA